MVMICSPSNREIDPNYDYEAYRGSYDDPREVIMDYFSYIHGNESKKNTI